ncbi:MAG: hypothetical protein HRT68_12785 [Flavobacteriaceae bacterium]|nr:hypothetical protein [Flavobacteriaceae bacterium]
MELKKKVILLLIILIPLIIYFVVPRDGYRLSDPVIYEILLRDYTTDDMNNYIDFKKFNNDNESPTIEMINNNKNSLEFYLFYEEKESLIYFNKDSIFHFKKDTTKSRRINSNFFKNK